MTGKQIKRRLLDALVEPKLLSEILVKRQKNWKGKRPALASLAFDHITNEIAIHGRYDDMFLSFLEEDLFPRMNARRICLDVGGMIGNHAIAFAPFFDRVFSLEPVQRTFGLLTFNTAMYGNISALNIGASDEERTTEIVLDSSNSGASSLHKDASKGALVPIRLNKLDNILPGELHGKIDFVKIDVEGHEPSVLMGMESILNRSDPVICLEINRESITQQSTPAVEFLKAKGYAHWYNLAGSKGSQRSTPGDWRVDKIDRLLLPSYNNLVMSRQSIW
jgi:FkbM family methyltransferase